MNLNEILQGDCLDVLKTLPSNFVDCVITSPPYWGLRDYGTGKWEGGDPNCEHKRPDGQGKERPDLPNPPSGWAKRDVTVSKAFNECTCGAKRTDNQLGLEKTPEEFVDKMVIVFREVRRVLKNEGTLWLNFGDSYSGSGRGRDADGEWNPGKGGSKQETNKGAITGRTVNAKSFNKKQIEAGAIGNAWVKPPPGLKPKDMVGIPWRVAFALQADGWYLRQDIIWHKPNPMPESVTDRCTKSHEYVFLMAKSQKYYFNNEAIREKASYDDPRMVDGFVPKSVNGKHSNDPQNAANRKKFEPDMAGGGVFDGEPQWLVQGRWHADRIPRISKQAQRLDGNNLAVSRSAFRHISRRAHIAYDTGRFAGEGRSARSVHGCWHDGRGGEEARPEVPRHRAQPRIYRNSPKTAPQNA